MIPLYVKLSDADRALLDELTAQAGARAGVPVRTADVVRRLIRREAVAAGIKPQTAREGVSEARRRARGV